MVMSHFYIVDVAYSENCNVKYLNRVISFWLRYTGWAKNGATDS